MQVGEHYPLESVRSFPSLVELAVIYESLGHLPSRRQMTPVRPLSTLSTVLRCLGAGSDCQAPRLRALLIENEAGSPLASPGQADLTLHVTLPPQLQYLTWISPDRHIQHFRVLRSLNSNEQPARLQLLPAIFRPKVDRKTGFWEDVFDSRHGYALFDHLTDDEPRLKYK
ncbi:hypothetical protein V8E36_008045 [Tilletia maclaganii]